MSFNHIPYRLVITDLKMPVMNGISMAKYFRGLQTQLILRPDLKLVLLTGGDKQMVVEEEQGLFDKITFKPLDAKALNSIY